MKRSLLILGLAVAVLLAAAAVANAVMCLNIQPFCDQITLQVGFGGIIHGQNDNCGSCNPFQVCGYTAGKQFVLFLDYDPVECSDFEMGMVIGSVVDMTGTLYRWWPDGTLYDLDPSSVSFVPCVTEGAEGAAAGPSGLVAK